MAYEYDLPSHHDTHEKHRSSATSRLFSRFFFIFHRRRAVASIILGAVVLSFLYVVHGGFELFAEKHDPSHPPLYEKWHQADMRLPQHNLDLPAPEGMAGKYFWVDSMPSGSGWGNFMQEVILDAYLAHKAGRTYVFGNYTWDRDGPEYSVYDGRNVIPSRVPLSSMLAGPAIGGPFPEGDKSPRSVRHEFFQKVCPNPTKINGDEIVKAYVWGSITTLVEKWVEKLKSIEDKCVQIEKGTFPPFSFWAFGSVKLLDIWEDLIQSPMMSQFRFSPLIEAGFDANIRRINPTSRLSRLALSAPTYPYTPIPGLLVLQVRRGDYQQHCEHLLKWSSSWQAFNKFPTFPDQFTPPPNYPIENPTEAEKAAHSRKCYPTSVEIAEKVKEILKTDAGKGLKNVYVMTNGKKPFIDELKKELGKVHKWGSVMSSRDLVVNWEQQYVNQAIDMLIGLRSQVMVGNGWSSMSSNIIMLRMALTDLSPDHNRFF